MQRTALTTLAAFSLLATMACGDELIITDYDPLPRENTIDAQAEGFVASQALDNREVDRSFGDYGMDYLYASIEKQQSRGLMTYFNIFNEDPTTEPLETGVLYGSSLDSDDVILGEDGDQYFRTDGETPTPVPDDVYVEAGECEGANIDAYDTDEPVDNVAFIIEECTSCEDQEGQPRTVKYMAWPTGRRDQAVFAEFTVREGLYFDEDLAGDRPADDLE